MRRCGAFLSFLFLLPCACARSDNAASAMRANVSETLTIKLAAAKIPLLVQAIQRDAAFDDPGVNVNLSPSMDVRRATSVQTGAYAQALIDARAKAATIARQLGVGLGAATGVTELARDGMGGGYQSAAQQSERVVKSVTVQAPGNGLVMLAVTYASALGPISVYGITPAPQQNAFGQADGVMLTMSTRSASLAAAGTRLRGLDETARRIARSFDATVSVSNASFNSF